MIKSVKKEVAESDDNYMSIEDLLILFAENIKIIFLIPFILCSLTIFYVFIIVEPTYTSTAKIMSSSTNSSGSFSQVAGLASQFGIDVPGQSQTMWVYNDMIKSRTVGRKIVAKTFDTNKFGKGKTLMQILTYGDKKPENSLEDFKTIAVDILTEDMITIDEDIRTGIFTIGLSSIEPMLSKQILDVLIKELDLHQQNYMKDIYSKTRIFIEDRIDNTKIELEGAEEKLKNFSDRNRRIENSPALLLEQQRLAREVTVLTGVFTTLKQQYETAKIEEVKDSNYILVLDYPELPIRKSKPQRKAMVIFAGFIGMFAALIISIVKDHFQNSSSLKKNKLIHAKTIIKENFNSMYLKK